MTYDQKEQLVSLKEALVEAELKRAEFILKSEYQIIGFQMAVYQDLCQNLETAEEEFLSFVDDL